MNTICIKCPMGCPLIGEERDGRITVSGNTCKRGEVYGTEEYSQPKRAITSLVRTESGEVASVKTSCDIPKSRIKDVVDFIGGLTACDEARIGDVVAHDVLGLGAGIVITGRRR